jgi:hypothetical protein
MLGPSLVRREEKAGLRDAGNRGILMGKHRMEGNANNGRTQKNISHGIMRVIF